MNTTSSIFYDTVLKMRAEHGTPKRPATVEKKQPEKAVVEDNAVTEKPVIETPEKKQRSKKGDVK